MVVMHHRMRKCKDISFVNQFSQRVALVAGRDRHRHLKTKAQVIPPRRLRRHERQYLSWKEIWCLVNQAAAQRAST